MIGKLSSLCLAACLLGLLAITGCETQQSTADPEPEWYLNGPKQPKAAKAEPAPKPAPKAGMVSSAIALPTGDKATSGLYIEKFAPATVSLNNEFTYEINVTNLTGVPLSNVQIEDVMPESYEYASASPQADSTAGGTITWDLGTMAARSTQTITVTGKATAEGTLTNCATGSYDLVACVDTQVVQPAIEIAKSGPAEVLQCDPITYEVVVTNPGTGPATNVVVVDNLPDGLETASGSDQVKFDIGTLAAGESVRRSANLRATKTGEFTNSATVTADGGLNGKSSVTTTVKAPKLEITKTAPNKTFIGKVVTYNIEVKNVGDGMAKNTVVTESLPAGATFVKASDGGQPSAGSVVWRVGNLAPEQTENFTVSLQAGSKGTLKNTASADADCADAVSASAQTVVEGIPAILLEVVDNPDPVAVGDTTTYTVTVTNQGSANGTNIEIVCKLEKEAQYVSGTGSTNVAVEGGTITMAPVKSLAPKATATWQVKVKAVDAGDVRFAVEMTSDQIGRPVNETEASNFYE